MQAATRLGLAFLLLIAAFLVLVSLAVLSLLAARQPTLAAVVATAGVAGVVAGAVTYLLARRGEEGAVEIEVEAPTPAAPAEPSRRPVKVQALPVAELPPAYLAAVMKGARARHSALKAQSRQA